MAPVFVWRRIPQDVRAGFHLSHTSYGSRQYQHIMSCYSVSTLFVAAVIKVNDEELFSPFVSNNWFSGLKITMTLNRYKSVSNKKIQQIIYLINFKD